MSLYISDTFCFCSSWFRIIDIKNKISTAILYQWWSTWYAKKIPNGLFWMTENFQIGSPMQLNIALTLWKC